MLVVKIRCSNARQLFTPSCKLSFWALTIHSLYYLANFSKKWLSKLGSFLHRYCWVMICMFFQVRWCSKLYNGFSCVSTRVTVEYIYAFIQHRRIVLDSWVKQLNKIIVINYSYLSNLTQINNGFLYLLLGLANLIYLLVCKKNI